MGLLREEEAFLTKEFAEYKKNHPGILDLYIGTKDKKTLSANLAEGGQVPKDMIQRQDHGIKIQRLM